MANDTASHPVASLHRLRIDPTVKPSGSLYTQWWVRLAFGLALLLGGASMWRYHAILGQPLLVQVAFARRIDASARGAEPVLSGSGYVVTGDRYISIGVRIPGRIESYEFEEGEFVRKGVVLVRLDDRDYRAALRKAEANLELAQANVVVKQKHTTRVHELHHRGFIALEALDVADNELAVAQARVQLSNAELDRVTARNNVALARETLRTAMGITGPFLFTLVDVLDRQGVAFDDEALVTQAYTNRPELRSLQAQRTAATAHLSALQKQYLPSVSGELQYSWTGRTHPLQDGWLWGVRLG
jgi:multidrug efflux pump subunit AcrA (membrane-fusion protein)